MISVVMPVYNREKTIGRAIESVLSQDFDDLELIIVDDCSTDKTENVIKSHKNSRIRYEKLKKNSGACVARNRGVELARGEIVAFQDSDDEWMPDKISKQYEYLCETGADVVFCKLRVYDDERFIKEAPRKFGNSRMVTFDKLLENSVASTQTIMGWKRCFLDTKFDPEMPRFQDWDIILRLARKYKIYYQAEALVKLNVQPDSISKNDAKGVNGLERIYNKFGREIRKNEKALSNYLIMMSVFDTERRKKFLAEGFKAAPSFYTALRVIKNMI